MELSDLFEIDVDSLSFEDRNLVFDFAKKVALSEVIKLRSGKCVSVERAQNLLQMKLMGDDRETFGLLLLNTQNEVRECVELFVGTIDSSVVYVREIIKLVLDYGCANVICYHNHPSGSSIPSSSDQVITAKIKKALSAVDCGLLDHIIVSMGGITSMRERGLV